MELVNAEASGSVAGTYYQRHRDLILKKLRERRQILACGGVPPVLTKAPRLVPGGHGGRSGRPRKTFVCRNVTCQTGASRPRRTRGNKSKFCSDTCMRLCQKGKGAGPRGGLANEIWSCGVCGNPFRATYKGKRFCSRACSEAWIKATLSNPNKSERVRETRRKCSRQRYRITGKIIVGRWKTVCERDGWACWICGGDIDPTLRSPHRHSGTADHVVALSRGGSDDDANLRAAHFGCNSKRGYGRFSPKGAEA